MERIGAEQERALIKRIRAGDRRAFQEIVETYKDEAFSLACSIVKDPQLAEDILQEVFLKVYDKLWTFRFQSSFYTWLYRMVVNRCYNELRKQKRNFTAVDEEIPGGEEASKRVDTQDLQANVNAALARMKPDEALIIRLFYLSELSIEEVMKVTGFGKSKVKVSLHRGRKNFAQIMKRQLGKEIEDL